MATQRVSLRLDEEQVGKARKAAGTPGRRSQLQHDRLTALLDDLEAETGPIPPRVMEEVRHEWTVPDEASDRRQGTRPQAPAP